VANPSERSAYMLNIGRWERIGVGCVS